MARQNLSRRQFLVQSASIAGTIGLGGPEADARVRSGPRGDLRVGIVGLGDRGRQLLTTLLGVEGVRVSAICDVHPERLRKALEIATKRGKPHGFTDAGVLFRSSEVDAVFIATPVWLHAPQTAAALDAGKHVYCEKPFALTAGECRDLRAVVRSAEARGLVYQSGFQRRFHPRYRTSMEFVHAGRAGPIHFVRAQWHAVTPPRAEKLWLHRRDQSGGIVLEQACHQFDVFNWLFGAVPDRASGSGGSFERVAPARRDVLDHYGLVLEYPGDRRVSLTHLTYAVPDRRFSGIYELAFGESSGVDLANALAWDASGKTIELPAEKGSDTSVAIAAFLRSIREGRRAEIGVDIAYRATMTALMARTAIDLGRPVTWAEIEAS